MHELGIVFHVIKTVEQVCREQQLEQVTRVSLELGEVSGVVEHYLADCWKWAVGKTETMGQAELYVETIPAITQCQACSKTYPTVAHGRTCPHCGSEKTYLLTGNQVNIKEIAAT